MLDENNTVLGVGGTRVKVGDVSFNRLDAINPPADTKGPEQATFFGITTDLGRVAPYVNFVDTAGAEMDSAPVGFSEIVAERGDANFDGKISASDFTVLRSIFFSGGYTVYADCFVDGKISASDFTCVRNKFFGL